MSFADWSNEQKKEKKSFSDWSNDKYNVPETITTTQEIYDKYGQYYHAKDYSYYSKKGSDIKNPTMSEAEGWFSLFGYRVGAKDIGNIVTYSRDNAAQIGIGKANGSNLLGNVTYAQMTDFEVGVYNYLLAKEGEKSAQKFLDDIQETLNAREGGRIADVIQTTDNPVQQGVLYGMQSIAGGAESAVSGIKQLFSEEKLPTTIGSFTSQALLEDLDGVGKYAYQAGNTIGNMLPSIAMNSVLPGSGIFVMGASSAGNAYAQKLSEGYTKEQAATYGVMVGSLETLTSKLLGLAGKGGTLTQGLERKIATIGNSALRFAAKHGLSIASEVAEEELQLWLEPLAAKIATGENYDVPTLEEMGETAVVTAMSTGILNNVADISSGNLTKVNGLTVNEARVLEAEVKNRVAAKEQNGNKLTKKQKNEIYDEVIKQLDKGYIGIDTIESVLGGEEYKTYQAYVESEDALRHELNELRNMRSGDMTDVQVERLAKLKGMNLSDNTKRNSMRAELSKKINRSLQKDFRLQESYNEITRRGQAFNADLSQYTGKQRAAVERAINSGILNNTNKSRELVNLLSKIEADKGIVFDYADNAKLKELGFALEGKMINGITKDGTVILNVQSPKVWQSTVGHEITHVLEGTEAYGALQKALFDYAKSKGEFESKKKALAELYKDLDADLDAELTADLVGEYLFSDPDFIRNLAKNRNLFQRIYDEIKYLCKVATGKQLTELEKVKREFDKAWKEVEKEQGNTSIKSGIKYSLRTSEDIQAGRSTADFIESIASMLDQSKISKRKFKIGDVSEVHKATIEKLMQEINPNFSADDYELWIDGTSADHINIRHGENGQADHSMATREDKELIPWVTNTPDGGEFIRDESGKLKLSTRYFNADGSRAPQIRLHKEIDGNTVYVSECVPDSKNKRIYITSAYKKSSTDQLLNIDSNKSPQPTPEASFDNNATKNSIRNSNEEVNGKFSLATENEGGQLSVGTPMNELYYDPDIAPVREDLAATQNQAKPKEHIRMEDFVNTESSVWRNVAYEDDATKASIMQETHNEMVEEGAVVKVAEDVSEYVADSFPDLRSMKKNERRPILKEAISKVKGNLRQFLNGFKNQTFEFDVDGKVLEAKLYNTGINEVLEKITQEKANMLYSTEGIFRNARYLYSTPDYDGDPNVYRWNYFYTPVQIGEETVGVRIAVRDTATPAESQIYNWGIKKDASLGGVGRGENHRISHGASSEASGDTSLDGVGRGHMVASHGVSSEVPNNIIPQSRENATGTFTEDSVSTNETMPEVSLDKDSFVGKRAGALYEEVNNMKKGVRASKELSYLLDSLDLSDANKADSYQSLRTALLNIQARPNQVVNARSSIETVARKMLDSEYQDTIDRMNQPDDVSASVRTRIQNLQSEIANNKKLRAQSNADYDSEIAEAQALYDSKKNKNSLEANKILRRIERLKRLKNQNDADYARRIGDLEGRIERMSQPTYKRAMQRKQKQNEYSKLMERLAGDTSSWKDKKLGISYKVNTLRRNLRDVVRDETGKQDLARADAIYDELQGKYNEHEAELKREDNRIKSSIVSLKMNHAEYAYAHMLGEFRHNPDTTLTQEMLDKFLEKNKGKIDTEKVDKAIDESRKIFDELIVRVNERLREQGMKEIPYRKGYFPHFTNPKQGIIAKLFNWKPVDSEIPTSIAGITETFNPERSYQSFNKERKSDVTDYDLSKALDTYVHGALDWIYHIEDIQKRRAFENYIRYVHSDEGVKARIEAIQNNEEYDADEMQEQIDLVYAEANNPLNNFVTDLRAGTNTLASKKSSMDRALEEKTNRKVYSVLTNVNNRVSANMVVGSVSSALTNFIPIVQSWVEVSPKFSLRAMGDTIRSIVRDDGTIQKSTFLTNRFVEEEKLYQSGWDKAANKAAFLMNGIDNFSSQTVWRSKYLQNISEGMSEAAAIKNADQFAENVIAGRSRGNQPTVFDAKNPLMKVFTAFQLEVNNQYGYMFKDAPQDSKNKIQLAKGYTTMLVGAYLYNVIYSSLVRRDAAFDPIGIIKDFIDDLSDDDEEDNDDDKVADAFLNLGENILQEVPFVGGLLGGGRVPISSAIPYSGEYGGVERLVSDISDGDWKNIQKELMKSLYYLAMPFGGGQLKKTTEGLGMFSDDFPIAGSYTNSGGLRFPVEDNLLSRLQAGVFGQYSSENAREYFDNGYAPLKKEQIQEFIDVDIPIKDYWEYREGLSKQETLEDKFDYIAGLDLPVDKKNILINNVVKRDEKIDLEDYEDFSGYEEFDFAIKNPEKYSLVKPLGGYSSYKKYTTELGDIESDKDANGKTISGSRKKKVLEYINNLDADYGTKILLFKTEYPSEDKYNADIVEYLNDRSDLSYGEIVTILTSLGMTVTDDGTVSWD